MDPKQIMERLAEATDAELTEAQAEIDKAVTELGGETPSEENIATLKTYAEARKAIKAELSSDARVTKRAELAAEQEKVLAEFSEPDPAPPAETPAEAAELAVETPPADDGGDPPENNEPEQEEAVTASGRKMGGITARQQAQEEPPATQALTVRTKTVAHGEIPGVAMGAPLNREALVDAFAEKFAAIKNVRSNGRYEVARVLFEYPEERVLTASSWQENTAKIEAANPQLAVQNAAAGHEEEALTAALCGPLEPLYDIDVLGVTDRPIRDALSRFTVERGGIQYRAPFDALAGLATEGMGVWTPADDDADPLVPKTCLEVACPGILDATVYATWLCLQFPNFTARFDREWVDATTRASLVAWARFAENQLLMRLLGGSKQLTAPVMISATRDILKNLDKVTAYYRYRHRLNSMVPVRWIAPRYLLDIMRADLSMGFPGDLDALRVADATIAAMIAARGVRVTWHLDGLADGAYDYDDEVGTDLTITAANDATYDDAAAGTAIPDFKSGIETVLFADGDWLFLDGGTMDLGLVRDSTLNVNNRYQTFVETWEGVANRGIESLRLTMAVEPTGLSVGTTTPAASDTEALPIRAAITPAAP